MNREPYQNKKMNTQHSIWRMLISVDKACCSGTERELIYWVSCSEEVPARLLRFGLQTVSS
jgi:hypothetical protein